MWWNGPHWLNEDEKSWPNWTYQNLDDNIDDEEAREVVVEAITNQNGDNSFQIINTNHFSKWMRLVRIIIWSLRLIKRITKNRVKWIELLSDVGNPITVYDYKLAEQILVKQAQNDEEMKLKLSFYIDENKLWRSLENSSLPEKTKHPLYLPRHNVITELIVLYKHESIFHAGVAHTLSEIRQSYWIPKGRSEVKRILNKCYVCKRWQAKPFKLPIMPSLPETRVRRSRTFENIGVDYLGPVSVISNIGTTKRWIALFTCFTTRAVHLEKAEDLSAETFMHIVRRFVSRRGFPHQIISDNALQFQSVFSIITQEYGKVNEFLTKKGIHWKSITPRAPWSGGLYERLVGLTKRAFRRAVGRKLLQERDLETLIIEIEDVLNTRPLINSDDIKAIRPVDFISPNASLILPMFNDDDDEIQS
ncbi:unnamed protein product [Wuchereria bancrofti]|uniref:Integrase catalytic domain-containing protein n=1 Tax=Wuchereria bancrofti TaxID=6293 RepID=A0A3P7DXQ1_WUCBA|nr:unnamed protein product [Wuchereria bancrofti]